MISTPPCQGNTSSGQGQEYPLPRGAMLAHFFLGAKPNCTTTPGSRLLTATRAVG